MKSTSGHERDPLQTASMPVHPQAGHQWGHLSGMTNLLIVLNVSLLLAPTGSPSKGTTTPFTQFFPLSLAALGAWLLFGLLNRLWYYPVFLFWDFMGAYFIVVRVWYWVNPSNAPLAD
jgi:hypothetical protein